MVLLRTATVWLAASALTGSAARWLLTGLPAGDTFVDLLVAGCHVVLVGCAVWTWLAITAVVVEVLRDHPSAARRGWAVPRPLRRAVLAACGVALTTGGVAVAAPPMDTPRDARVAVLVAGLPYPARAHDIARPLASAPSVLVRPGDSLWMIAARHLADGATDAAIARTCALLHRLNRDVIGDDPGLIHPGQRLRLPG